MRSPITLAALAATAVTFLSVVSAVSEPDFNAPPISNISLYPNGSLFYHWRPVAHFLHPSNQLGDPTAFWQTANGTSHITALYSYLGGTGNSSLSTSAFSGSTTNDFIHYEDLSSWQTPVQMGPGNQVDFIADFDGSVVAQGYKGLPTLIWTAVKGLPISWTIPYTDGYESQALAYSDDDGKTWKKLDGGTNIPVIPRPPYQGSVVTGFRDPYIFENRLFDRLLNSSTSSESNQTMHYISVSSGLHPAMPGLSGVELVQAGPRVWLYRQSSPGNWLNWTFCGPLLHSTINTTFVTPGSGWAATDYSDGNNYETAQVANLDFSGDSSSTGTGMAFMSYGAESNHTLMLYRLGHWRATNGIHSTPVNATLAPGVVGSDRGVQINTALQGVLDWGLAYACTGLRDQVKERRMVYCWIKEAFANQDATKFVTQYISSLTLPRQLFVKRVERVVNNALVLQNASWAILNKSCSTNGEINTIPVSEFKASSDAQNKTVDLVMLGVEPASELLAFRTQANDSFHLDSTIPSPVLLSAINLTLSNTTATGELQMQLRQGVASGTKDALVDELIIPLPRTPLSNHFELQTKIDFPLSSLRNTSKNASFAAGISILGNHNKTQFEDLAIVYQPANESIIVQRRTALGTESVLTAPEVGKLRLWQIEEEDGQGVGEKVESLNMRVFVDGSAVEVYINDVFVLTTRGYYWYENSTSVGFVYQVPHGFKLGQGEAGVQVKYSNTSWWEGLVDAYPHRPKDKQQLIKEAIGYPEPANNPNAHGIIYNGTGPSPPFPHLD